MGPRGVVLVIVLVFVVCYVSLGFEGQRITPKGRDRSMSLVRGKCYRGMAVWGSKLGNDQDNNVVYSLITKCGDTCKNDGGDYGDTGDVGGGGGGGKSKGSNPSTSYAVLALVPLVWGTYAPVVKILYSTAPLPPPTMVFTMLSYFASVATLNVIGMVREANKAQVRVADERHKHAEALGGGGLSTGWDVKTPSVDLRAGIELGLFLFVASNIQVMGIQQTTAIRAGVLVQLTTIIVPIAESILGKRKLDANLWMATILAGGGVLCVSVDNPLGVLMDAFSSGLGPIAIFPGDVLICISAVIYSLHVIRLGRWAPFVDTFSLAKVKASTELVVSLIVLGWGLLSQNVEYTDYISDMISNPSKVSLTLLLASCLWNGALPTAFTMWAQAFGQRTVSPTEANLIYSSQPIWSSIFAYFLLGESLVGHELVGCALLATAVGFSLPYGQKKDKGSCT